MPTAPLGPWYEQALARGLIRESAAPRASVALLDPPPDNVSEKAFMAAVVALARSSGWKCYHTRNSRGSAAGWPDLALVRAGVLLLAELKTDVGRLSDDQAEWLRALRAVEGIRVRLWRPSLWSAIVAELA